MTRPRIPAVFLDRDGTLIHDAHYLADPAGVKIIPGVPNAIRLLERLGFRLVVVTNQSGLARGLITPEQYKAVAAQVDRLLAAAGVSVDLTLLCPHHPDYSGSCICRKPGTGMHRDASRRLRIDLARSWYIGDKLADVLPALETGGRGILVRTGKGTATEAEGVPEGVLVADDLLAAARMIRALQDADSR